MTTSIQLRRCEHADLAAVAAIEVACFGADALPLVALTQYFELFPTAFFVAQEGNRCVGFVVAGAGADTPTEAWLLSVGVLAAHRRHGVALQLGEAVFGALRERGVTTVWATVAPDNLPSRAACEKVGFEMVRLEPDYFGRGAARFLLQLTLTASL